MSPLERWMHGNRIRQLIVLAVVLFLWVVASSITS